MKYEVSEVVHGMIYRAGTLEMVTAACMFGNSMTLPLVFLSSLLAPAVSAQAVGFLALYQMAWSPLLWALGPRVLHPSGAASHLPQLISPRSRLPASGFKMHVNMLLHGVTEVAV